MSRYEVKLTMRPLGWLDRRWYRHLGIAPPFAIGRSHPDGRLARLVPYRLRRFHRAYAATHGFFWIRCPICDLPFGGHEAGGDIPDPMRAPSGFVCICSKCTRAGKASR